MVYALAYDCKAHPDQQGYPRNAAECALLPSEHCCPCQHCPLALQSVVSFAKKLLNKEDAAQNDEDDEADFLEKKDLKGLTQVCARPQMVLPDGGNHPEGMLAP